MDAASDRVSRPTSSRRCPPTTTRTTDTRWRSSRPPGPPAPTPSSCRRTPPTRMTLRCDSQDFRVGKGRCGRAARSTTSMRRPTRPGTGSPAQEDRGRAGAWISSRRRSTRRPSISSSRCRSPPTRSRRSRSSTCRSSAKPRARGKPMIMSTGMAIAGGDRRRPSTRRAPPAARRSLCSSAPAPIRRRRRR